MKTKPRCPATWCNCAKSCRFGEAGEFRMRQRRRTATEIVQAAVRAWSAKKPVGENAENAEIRP